MLESRYALKYSMPHSVVHIIDNSMYAGELPTVIADDPSLYSTLVVTGAPMGADNEIISINRSDVLNVSYGMSNLSPADIKKFGQTVTYPSSILSQNAPIKFMRVTPDDSTYAFSCLLVQWKWDGNTMHVRFKTTEDEGNNGLPPGIIHSNFKNVERFNAALVRGFSKTVQIDGTDWTQRVFMTNIAAGRGKIYNNYNYTINLTQQSRRPANARYLFSSVDTRTSNIVEQFAASLINENNSTRLDAIDSVNVVVGQRVKGSSILIPTINESAIKELYTEYMTRMKEMIDSEIPPIYGTKDMKFVQDVYATMSINIFDAIYGRYIYNGDTDVKLPYYQVDMIDLDIPQLYPSNRIKTFLDPSTDVGDYLDQPTDIQELLDGVTYGITNPDDTYHIGDIFCNAPTNLGLQMIIGINQYTGAITYLPITQVYTTTDRGTNASKDMFRAYVFTTDSAEAVKTATQSLVKTRKLVPRVKEVNGDNLNVFYDDYIIAGINGTANPNKLNAFKVYKISYTPQSVSETSAPTIAEATVLEGPDLFNTFVYPASQISSFAIEGSDSEYLTIPGSTILKVEGEGDSKKITGEVAVNGYNIAKDPTDRFDIASNSRFSIGVAPTKAPVATDMIGSSYDDMIYQATDQSTTTITWKITSGESVDSTTAAPVTGYTVGDLVLLADSESAPTGITYFKVVAADAVDSGQKLTLAVAGSKGSTNKISPATYDTTWAGYRKLTEDPSTETWSNAITITNTGTPEEPSYEPAFAENTYYTESGNKESLVTSADGWGTTITTVYTVSGDAFDPESYKKFADGEFVSGVPGDTYASTDWYAAVTPTPVPAPSGLKVVVTAENISTTVSPKDASPAYIYRFTIGGTQGSLYRYGLANIDIPSNYYSPSYGVNPNSELGGIAIDHGYAGFFDDNISDIEFKWRYSELLVKAYRGYIDARITSPTRCPVKYLFDGATNTIVGQTILPYMHYNPIDIINASTIYTDDEKESVLLNNDLVSNIKEFADIDVKQAMYDLTILRVYQMIPEDKRPIGPGSGLSLHLDSGVTDGNTAMLVNQSFTKRFDNPNASWDIGGYVSSVDGISYTYTKKLVDSMFAHMKQYSVNKPFTGKYTNIAPSEYSGFFPDIDTTDWELRELYYNSGGNTWIMDINGNLQRQSQRTLDRGNGTSDLIQESNMRTLSQLVYLLQNKINTYLLEYNDDGVLETLKDECDNMFSNWIGNLVQDLEIIFQRDINPEDGGEIVVCYVNVTFRGLILRVPIIVNVQRRTTSE